MVFILGVTVGSDYDYYLYVLGSLETLHMSRKMEESDSIPKCSPYAISLTYKQ